MWIGLKGLYMRGVLKSAFAYGGVCVYVLLTRFVVLLPALLSPTSVCFRC